MTAQSRVLAFLIGVDVLLLAQAENVRLVGLVVFRGWLGLLQ